MILPNTTIPPSLYQAVVRLVNISPNNNPVSLEVDGEDPDEFTNIAYKNSSTGYIPFSTGTHTLTIPDTSVTRNYNFQELRAYSIFIFWDTTLKTPGTKILVSTESNFSSSTVTPRPVVSPTPGVPQGPGSGKLFMPLINH